MDRAPRNWIAVASAEHAHRGVAAVPMQCFMSFGIVLLGEPYAFDMGGFVPLRRDVHYLPASEAPIHPLLDHFAFVEDRARWWARFRLGPLGISDAGMRLIAGAMKVAWPPQAVVEPALAA